MAIITLNGMPGSGKSTLAKLLAKRLNYKHYSIGDLRRKFAIEKRITLAELNRLSETGEEDTDSQFDEYQIGLATKEEDFVIDSRLGWHFLPESIKLFIDADEEERARRLLSRESVAESPSDLAHAKEMNQQRVESDRQRYLNYYEVDPWLAEHYDLLLDSTKDSPEELVRQILEQFPELEEKGVKG